MKPRYGTFFEQATSSVTKELQSNNFSTVCNLPHTKKSITITNDIVNHILKFLLSDTPWRQAKVRLLSRHINKLYQLKIKTELNQNPALLQNYYTSLLATDLIKSSFEDIIRVQAASDLYREACNADTPFDKNDFKKKLRSLSTDSIDLTIFPSLIAHYANSQPFIASVKQNANSVLDSISFFAVLFFAALIPLIYMADKQNPPTTNMDEYHQAHAGYIRKAFLSAFLAMTSPLVKRLMAPIVGLFINRSSAVTWWLPKFIAMCFYITSMDPEYFYQSFLGLEQDSTLVNQTTDVLCNLLMDKFFGAKSASKLEKISGFFNVTSPITELRLFKPNKQQLSFTYEKRRDLTAKISTLICHHLTELKTQMSTLSTSPSNGNYLTFSLPLNNQVTKINVGRVSESLINYIEFRLVSDKRFENEARNYNSAQLDEIVIQPHEPILEDTHFRSFRP